MKVCPYCGIEKELASFRSERNKCRDCEGEDRRAWRLANPEKVRKHNRARDREKERARFRIYYDTHAEQMRERARVWAKNNPEKKRATARHWYAEHTEQWKKRNQTWLKANPDKAQSIREKTNTRRAKWEKEHPNRSRDKCARRRAITCGAGVVERVSRDVIWERDNGYCHLCGKECDPNNWHLDHLLPLSRGGTHEPSNVAVAHPECNMAKGNKILTTKEGVICRR